MKRSVVIPIEVLHRYLSYNANTGSLRWRIRPTLNSTRKAGDVAGCVDKRRGNLVVRVPGYPLTQAHRIVWAISRGTWPELIDHINGDPSDNRLANLRAANHRINCENRRRPLARPGSAGLLGVVYSRNGYQAQIGVRGQNIYLGRFRTAEAAHAAYLAAKRAMHEGNTL